MSVPGHQKVGVLLNIPQFERRICDFSFARVHVLEFGKAVLALGELTFDFVLVVQV